MVGSTGISFSGLASGIDTQAIVRQLVQIERLPIQTLQSRRSAEQRRLDLVSQLGDLVKALQKKAEALQTTGEFKSNAATISDATIGTVTAGTTAIAGSHTLEVVRLAATDRWVFDAVSSRTEDLSTTTGQQVDFTIGQTSYSLSVDPSRSSLDEIAADINNMASVDVNASVVNTGTESNPTYQLVLASKVPGEDGRITGLSSNVGGASENLTVNWIAPDGNGVPQSGNNITVGNDARALIDGLLVRRSDNDFSNVLEGVTISFSRTTTPGDPAILSVEPDREAVRAKIDEFVASYNAVQSLINSQSTFTPSTEQGNNGGTTGILFGDTLLTGVRSALDRALFRPIAGQTVNDPEAFSTLSIIGIKRDRSGLLSVDDTKFDEKFSEDLDALAGLFTDDDGFDNGGAVGGSPEYYVDQSADSGLMASLVREVGRMFGTLPGSNSTVTLRGIFDAKRDAIKERMKNFDRDIERKERRIESFEQNLILQYARFEELMSSLNAQGASLNGALRQSLG